MDQTRPSIVYVSVPFLSGGSLVSPTLAELKEQMYRSHTVFPAEAITYAYDSLANSFASKPAPADVNLVLALKRTYDTGETA